MCWFAGGQPYGRKVLNRGTDEQHKVELEVQPGQSVQGLVRYSQARVCSVPGDV